MKIYNVFVLLMVHFVCCHFNSLASRPDTLASWVYPASMAAKNEVVENSNISSPDGKLVMQFDFTKDTLNYELLLDGNAVLSSSPLYIEIDNHLYLPKNCLIKSMDKRTVNQKLVPEVKLKAGVITENYNENVFQFGEDISLRVRAFNDAIAYRWETNVPKEELIVNDERFSLNFKNKNLSGWMPKANGDGFFSHHECMYVYKSIAKTYSSPFPVPLLVELGGGKVMLVTDVNVEHFPGLWLDGNGGRFETSFPQYPKSVYLHGSRSMIVSERENYIAKIPGHSTMPWRVMMVTSGKGLLESNTLYSLADPSRIGDASWIKPGKVTWDWWNQFALENVDFEPGVNQKTYMHYIDFAAENKLPYLLLDEGWSAGQVDRFLEVVPELDMPALSAYAREKGVKLLLWCTSTTMDKYFEKAFQKFEEWGIAGIKMDFMQRDDQIMNEFCYKVAAEAAKRKMLVDFHGGGKPTGLIRTYPNVLSQEAVMGMEQNLWNTKANPDMAVMNAFVRMSVGPLDYTPGAMINMTPDSFKTAKSIDYKEMGSMGTRCQQLALYVVYTSPVQMLCDSPTRYRNNPTSMDFLREVPTVWDETLALHADPCKSLILARRNGERWFVGAITNSSEREILLDFSFLPKGKEFLMKSWADGINANSDGKDHVITERKVNSDTKITISLAKGGGFAAIIK